MAQTKAHFDSFAVTGIIAVFLTPHTGVFYILESQEPG